jgi:hypothetical protein
MSRHGIMLPNNTMDDDKEKSGKDQAAVMYDGCILDDCIGRLIQSLPEITFIYINDSCHSETQYKLLPDLIDGKLTISKSLSKDYVPSKNNILDIVQLESLFTKQDYKQRCTVISLASSLDTQPSLDVQLNGVAQGLFTGTLLKILRDNPTIRVKDIQAQLRKQIGYQQTPVVQIEGLNTKKVSSLKLF